MAFKLNDISKKFRKSIKSNLKRRGWLLIPDKFSESYLRNYNFEIATLIDIGVGRGTPSLYKLYSNRRIVMIDPFPAVAERCAAWLSDPNFDIKLLNCAAGECETELELSLRGDGSSLQQRIGREKAVTESALVRVRRLDDLVAEHAITGPFGIKIDTEGSELGVVRGACETLKNTQFVIAEVSVKQRFKGGYTFSEFVSEMARNGFEVADIVGIREHSRFFDVLFVPGDSSHLKAIYEQR